MEIINTAHAPAAIGPYSQGMITDNLIFFSGQIALLPEGSFLEGDLQAQATQVFKNIDALLEEVNADKTQIAKATVWLSDLSNFTAFNTLYKKWLGGHKPARSCVQAQLPKDALVEVEVIVARG